MKLGLTRSGDELMISLRGDINEACEDEFRELIDKIEVATVVFDAERVELINSMGARYWINLTQTLIRRSVSLRFRRCSPAFIESCNIYPKFVPKKSIESLFIPADCSVCHVHQMPVVSVGAFSIDDPFDQVRCNKCGGTLTAEIDLEEYLQCLKELYADD